MQALLYGAARVASGAFDYTLVVAHCKESEGNPHPVTGSMFDPFTERQLGLDALLASALQAQRYQDVTGITAADLAVISQRNHSQAKRNPYAQRTGDYTLEQIEQSPVVAGLIRELLAGPSSDGACALMLANADQARRFGDKAVWIAGLGNSTDAYWTDRELAESKGLEDAAARAYRAAGIANPHKEIDVAEISARYAFEEPLYAEALGLCDRKQLREWIAAKTSGPTINPSGGAITGNPATVIGLTRAIEAYLQLSNQAGERQVDGARAALAHGRDGICGQSQAVAILRSNTSVN
jgi:acetyl-CoA C-acetyltransferase